MLLRFISIVAAGLLLSACTYRIAERNIVIPKPGELVQAGQRDGGRWTVTPLAITADDGFNLHGAVFRKAGSMGRVLYFGGNGFVLSKHADFVLREYRDLPLDVVIFDHRGYGANPGETSMRALFDDGLTVYDGVRAAVPGPGPLLVHGHSLGSFIAGEVASKRTLDGLILESTATTTQDWVNSMAGAKRHLVRLRIDEELKDQGNLHVMAGLDEPLLIVSGEKDTVTRPVMARALYAAAALPTDRKELLVVPGANHMQASTSPEFVAAVQRLLEKATPPAP